MAALQPLLTMRPDHAEANAEFAWIRRAHRL